MVRFRGFFCFFWEKIRKKNNWNSLCCWVFIYFYINCFINYLYDFEVDVIIGNEDMEDIGGEVRFSFVVILR